MKDFYIVKKDVLKNILRPTNKITIDEFTNLIDKNSTFTWFEETNHGKKKESYSPSKKKVTAYLNYNKDDEKSFTQLIAPFDGYIRITFDYKVNIQNLKDLIDIANSINCNLWQYKPKQMIIDKEFAENYGKRKKKESD